MGSLRYRPLDSLADHPQACRLIHGALQSTPAGLSVRNFPFLEVSPLTVKGVAFALVVVSYAKIPRYFIRVRPPDTFWYFCGHRVGGFSFTGRTPNPTKNDFFGSG